MQESTVDISYGETQCNYFRYLKHLLPGKSDAEILEALSRTPDLELPDKLAAAGSELGAHFYELNAPLADLLEQPLGLPALEPLEHPRVLLQADPRHVTVLWHNKKQRIARDDFGDHERRFLIASPRMNLTCLHGRQRVGRVLSYLASESTLLKALIIYAVFVEALSLAAPLTVQVLINTISFGMMTQQLIVLSLLLMIALSGAALLKILQQVLVEHLSRRFFARTVMDYVERLPRVQPGKMQNPIHRFFEVASVDKTFFVLGLDMVALVLQVFTATVLLALYHPVLLGFTLMMVLSSWLVFRLPFSAGLSRSLQESLAKYELADFLQRENQDELEQMRLFSRWETARRAGFRIALGQQAGLFAIQVVLSVALLFIGGALVIRGQLTLGQLVAAELVAGTALISLGKLGKQLPKIYDLITSFEKLGSFVDLPVDDQEVQRELALARAEPKGVSS